MTRFWLCAALSAGLLAGEDKWIRIRSGPFEVVSNAGERSARDRMLEAEQFRFALGNLLGKKDLQSVWPIRIAVLKDRGAAATGGIAMGRDSWVSAAGGPAWRTACARILIHDNTQRLPAEIERGLIDLISTLEINGTHLSLGAPPPEKTKDWARVRLIACAPEYQGRMRVFVSNLEQGGDYEAAYKNAFEKKQAQLDQEVDASLARGEFPEVSVPGRALSEKDFTVREAPAREGVLAMADLAAVNGRSAEAEALYRKAGGAEGDEGLKRFAEAANAGSKNARTWLALGTADGFRKAAELNPKWAEPHVRLAALEKDPGRRATELKKAVELDPRNAETWKAFASALMDARQYVMAAKAWSGAERASESPAERERMRAARLAMEAQRADFEESERKRRLEEEARDLQRVKNAAMAEILEAQNKANSKLRAEHGEKPAEVVRIEDLDKANRLEGTLERVDCLPKGQAKLHVRAPDNKLVLFTILDPQSVGIAGGGEKAFHCGPQKPVRTVVIEYRSATDVQSIEFK